MSAGLRFQVLGSVRATLDDRPVDLGGPRQRSVLARLVLADGRAVSAEVLVADLWQEDLQPRAIALLQAHISLLRRVLEPGRAPRTPATVLVTEPPGYALRTGGAVDALQLAALMAQGEAALRNDPQQAAAQFEAATALWRGPAYAEFADERWAAAEIHRLEELRLTLVERRAAAHLELGDPAAAVRLLQPHVADHPLREASWRLLGLSLYRSGRQADALAALRSARDRLADELGIDPGPELRPLEQDILTQAPRLTSDQPAGHSATRNPPAAEVLKPAAENPRPATTLPTLVGRDDELQQLTAAAHQAAAGSLQIALVSAEAGGGKTALLDELVRRLPGWAACRVRCPETDGAPSGWPWIEALQNLSQTHPPTDRQPLAPWLDSGADTEVGSGDEVRNRFRVHRAVAAWLAAVGADTPLLLVIDDLHRADDETVTLLADLVAALRAARVLVAIGLRPESTPELTRTLATLARFAPLRLELTGLTPAAVDQLVDDLALTDLDEATRAAISARTAGNPFFVRELVRLLGTGAEVGAIPNGVRDVVRQRIAALPAQSGTLLKIAAVGGREMSVDVLLDAAQAAADPQRTDDDSVLDALELGVVSGLLTEPAPGRVRFGHAIVRDTLYADLTSLRAARWHSRIARALERLEPDDVTALAHHYESAGPAHVAAAARYAAAAAELAEQRFGYSEAANWWRRAGDALAVHRPDDVAARLNWLARAIRAAQLTGNISLSRSLRADALPAAVATDDPELIAAVILAADVPTVWSPRSVFALDLDMIALCVATADRLPDRPDLRSRLHAVIAVEMEGDADPGGYAASLTAVSLARETGDPEVLAYALYSRYLNTYRDGAAGVQERGAVGREMLAIGRAHGLGLFEATAHLVLIQYSCAVLDLPAADHHAAEAGRLAAAYGLPLLAGVAHWYGALRLAMSGRWDEAEAAYGAAAAEVGATGFYLQSAQMTWWTSIVCLRLSSGRSSELADMLGMMVGSVSEEMQRDAAELIAVSLLVGGKADQARALVGEMFPIRPDYFAPVAYALRGLAGVYLSDQARVEQAYAALLPHRETVCGAGTGTLGLGLTATFLAQFAAFLGDDETARTHQQEAVAIAQSLGNADWTRSAQHALEPLTP